MAALENLNFRPAKSGDLLRLISMLANDRIGPNRESADSEFSEGYVRFFDLIYSDPHNTIYVVENGDGIVGTFQLTFIPSIAFGGHWRAHVESVRVATAYRSQGLGKTMMEWIFDKARERECLMVQLASNKQRDGALEFYQKVGFEASHEGLKKYLI